jgi:MFS family permease
MSLSLGVAGGLIVDGVISINNPWRVDYYVAIVLIGALGLVIFFTFPETAFKREYTGALAAPEAHAVSGKRPTYVHDKSESSLDSSLDQPVRAQKYSYGQQLKLFNGSYTQESVLVMVVRPLLLILLPQVRLLTSGHSFLS